MTARAGLALCAVMFFLGCLLGWAVRIHTTNDRYINGLASQHETAERYYNTKLTHMISDNERKYKNGK